MTETAASPVKEPSKKKAAAAGGKAATTKPSHPPTAVMVNAAVETLKERGGSSLQAIKKYISSTYKVDAEKLAPFIRKYIKSAVASGKLVQTKGSGTAGSFKLPVAGATAKKKASPLKGKEQLSKVKKAASPQKGKVQPSKAKKAPKPNVIWARNLQEAKSYLKTLTGDAGGSFKVTPWKKTKASRKKVVKKPAAKKASPKKK